MVDKEGCGLVAGNLLADMGIEDVDTADEVLKVGLEVEAVLGVYRCEGTVDVAGDDHRVLGAHPGVRVGMSVHGRGHLYPLGRVDDDGMGRVLLKFLHPGTLKAYLPYLNIHVTLGEVYHLARGGLVGLGVAALGHHRLDDKPVAGYLLGEIAQGLDTDNDGARVFSTLHAARTQ